MSRGLDSVGSLLADVANRISAGLQILRLADKRHWGQDEKDHVACMEAVLDQAKKDFQQMGPLVNGQSNYERDRKHETIEELKALATRFREHAENLKDWARSGGSINPIWTRDLSVLQRELHRAQCRAARRVFSSGQEATLSRCLGAFLVRRKQRVWTNTEIGAHEGEYQRRYLEELMACKSVGSFERFGQQDIAFICDFCDGHMVWEDLDNVPTVRTAQDAATSPISPVSPMSGNPYWQATGATRSTLQDKQVVFAPVAIANHMVPVVGEWQAKLLCPFCEEEGEKPLDEDDEEDIWRPDHVFEDVEGLREHLEWHHGGSQPLVNQIAMPQGTDSCQVM